MFGLHGPYWLYFSFWSRVALFWGLCGSSRIGGDGHHQAVVLVATAFGMRSCFAARRLPVSPALSAVLVRGRVERAKQRERAATQLSFACQPPHLSISDL